MDSPVIMDNASEFGRGLNLDRDHLGFPFDDDNGLGRRNEIRSHLDDLASRHPEFADHLLGPPWDIPFHGSLRNRRQGSGQAYPDEDARSQASGGSAASGASGVSSHGEAETQIPVNSQESQETRRNPIPQYGARNTVDIGQTRHNMENADQNAQRSQRSMSAPPENRQQQQTPNQGQQRFVSRVEITPQQQQSQQQQPPQPQQQQREKSPAPQSQGNVRHIPIFVEGRDVPVLPKNVEPEAVPPFRRSSPFGQNFSTRSQHQWPPHFQDPFFQRDRDQFDGPRWGSHTQAHQPPQNQQPYRQQQPEKPRTFHQQEPPHQQQQHHYTQQQQPPQPEPAETPKPKQPPPPKDPLEKVALVQKEVDALTEQVKQFNGTSRQDKQYIYLDEMLTRELIKLDDIETEGKENVRQARKNAIKSIQESISLLESKVPLPQEQQELESEVPNEEQTMEENVAVENVETESQQKDSEMSQQSAIPLPPCTSASTPASTQVPMEEQNQNSVQTDAEDSNITTPMDQVTTETDIESSMEVQVAPETQQPVTEEATAIAVPCENKIEEMKESEKVESVTVGVEQSSQEQMKVDTIQEMEDQEKKETKTTKKGKKTKKKPTPVSEQAIPLPPPEAKSATN